MPPRLGARGGVRDVATMWGLGVMPLRVEALGPPAAVLRLPEHSTNITTMPWIAICSLNLG